MSQPFQLFRLQQIDSQLDQGGIRLREIDVALNDHAAMNQVKQQAEESTKALETARKELHRAEQNVQAQRIKIEQTEAALYGGKVRNPKELQDLQNESAALKRFLDTLEERQLEVLIAIEEVEERHKESMETLAKVTGESEQNNRQLIAEKMSLEQEVSRLEGERRAAASPISPADLALYEKLRQQRRGVAVAKINNSVCSGCGSALNASLLQAAHSPSQLARCETCGRILYAG
jgi:hypothetical protein